MRYFLWVRVPCVFVGCLFFAASARAQTAYEKGYFIDKYNQRTECYIKAEAWKADSRFSYLLDLKNQPLTKPLSEVKEIGVAGVFKIRHTKVLIDMSGDESPLISYTSEPEWHTEELFLWTLVDGHLSLYAFETNGLKRYFFSIGNGPIEQLVYKKYHTTSGISLNETYKQTLFDTVNCGSYPRTYFENLPYQEQALVKHFLAENTCRGSAAQAYLIEPQNNALTLPSTRQLDEREKPKPAVVEVKEPAEPRKVPVFTGPRIRYVGVEVNPLLRQIINLNPNSTPTNNPFGLHYESNSTKTGRGWATGLTFTRTRFKDDSNGTLRETVERDIAFRIGYDRKHQMGKRWIVAHGYDLVFGGAKSRTEADQFGVTVLTETKTNYWGIGPRAGLMFLLSEYITLGTETTYYLRFITDKTRLTGLPDAKQTTSEFKLTVPVVLILSIRF